MNSALLAFENYISMTEPFKVLPEVFLQKESDGDVVIFKHEQVQKKWIIWQAVWASKKHSVAVQKDLLSTKIQKEDPNALNAFENYIRETEPYAEKATKYLKKFTNSYEPTNPQFLNAAIDSIWNFWLIAWNSKP